jgi:hypothetical protein
MEQPEPGASSSGRMSALYDAMPDGSGGRGENHATRNKIVDTR